MKKRFFIGLMLMLFAFIVTPFQTKASAVDVDVGIEQSDMDITLPDAIQPEMYTVEAGSQVATPLIYPTLACEYNYVIKANQPTNGLYEISSSTVGNSRYGKLSNNPVYGIIYSTHNEEGLFRLDIGENLNHSKLARNRE